MWRHPVAFGYNRDLTSIYMHVKDYSENTYLLFIYCVCIYKQIYIFLNYILCISISNCILIISNTIFSMSISVWVFQYPYILWLYSAQQLYYKYVLYTKHIYFTVPLNIFFYSSPPIIFVHCHMGNICNKWCGKMCSCVRVYICFVR